MDVTKGVAKVAGIVLKINEYYEKLIAIRDKYINKINDLIGELEDTINNAIKYANQGLAWLQAKIDKIMYKIQKYLDAFLKKIKEIIQQVKDWYNKVMLNIKTTVVLAAFTKVGVDMNRKSAEILADTLIPHPSIDSLIPDLSFNLNIEGLINLGEIQEVSLPRIEI